MALPSRRLRQRFLGLTMALAAVLFPIGGMASADPAPPGPAAITALMLRDDTTTVFRQPGATMTLTEALGTQSSQGTDYPVFYFNSQVGSDPSTFESVDVSAGLAPGTYTTSRMPGDAQAVLDPGSFLSCGGAEPGTLTVQEADYDGDGNPVDFAASFDVASCDGQPPAHGELRWDSTTPLALVQAPMVTSSKVTVNSSTEATVNFTATGNSPATLGPASLSQAPTTDPSLSWSLVTDGCSGRILSPGDSCSVTARIAPIRPNGVPHGAVDATLVVPDGQPIAAAGLIEAVVYPLSGQPVGLAANGGFRHISLTWGAPLVAPAGWSPLYQRYEVYQYLSDGTPSLVAVTAGHSYQVTGLPDLYTARFAVRDLQSGTNAPLSVPAGGTTATSELLYYGDEGLVVRRLSPDPEDLTTSTSGLWPAEPALTVSRNQSVVAYEVHDTLNAPPIYSLVCTHHVDTSSGADFCSAANFQGTWDTAPSLSTDGKRIVFTHATAPDAPTQLEIASTATGSKPTPVPNSTGLTDASFDPAGTGLVAEETSGTTTDLVALSLTGTRTVIAGTTGLSDPDVAADGRIVAVNTEEPPVDGSTDGGTAPTTELVLLASPTATPVPIAQAATGSNLRPRFSADGRTVFFTHSDTTQAPTPGYGDKLEFGDAEEVNLDSGIVTDFGGAGNAGTPYVLVSDGTQQADRTPPVARLLDPSVTVDLGSTATVGWSATDPPATHQVVTGVRNYDVRYRTASAGHALGAYSYPASWQGTTLYVRTIPTTAGTEYCFSVRARDFAGNVSAWTPDRCTTSPVDDRSLHTTARRLTSTNYYRHTYSYAATKYTRFTLGGVSARQIGIVVTTCSACGQMTVSLGSHTLGRINTHASSTHYRQTLWLPTTATIAGTLTLTSLSTTPVRVDGVVVLH